MMGFLKLLQGLYLMKIGDTSKDKDYYLVNERNDFPIHRGKVLESSLIIDAVYKTHKIISELQEMEFDLFSILGMRNLSAFVGEVFASQMVLAGRGLFRKNPHQDGYPDLLLMDDEGTKSWNALSSRLRDKKPFSPFQTGGIEVKATCGSVPTPKECAKKGIEKPGIGDQRIGCLKGYDWKAHHRETNNLIGIYWDFIDQTPHIVGVFYSSCLTPEDWGKIIQPISGGGRTTSVSIMKREGVRKMCESWVLMLNDERYKDFFCRYNKLSSFTNPSEE